MVWTILRNFMRNFTEKMGKAVTLGSEIQVHGSWAIAPL